MFQVDVDNEVVMHFQLSLIYNLDFKPLFVPIEENSWSVYTDMVWKLGKLQSG